MLEKVKLNHRCINRIITAGLEPNNYLDTCKQQQSNKSINNSCSKERVK